MSRNIAELLLSGSIQHPSPSLMATFEALAEFGTLPPQIDIGKLLRSMITHSRHTKAILYSPALTSIAIGGDATQDSDIRSLLLLAARIASRLKYDEVTEMHLLLAILESQPANFTAAIQPFVVEFEQKFPQGTKRQQMMLDFALAQNRADWIAKARYAIEETPLSITRIHERVVKYLSSPYYPYGSSQWKDFRRDYPHYDDLSGESAEIQGAYIRFLENGILGK